jgi:hypothetical protein
MANERITESIVRQHLDKSIGSENPSGARYVEQISDNPRIQKLLSGASKNLGGGQGKPEFIVMFEERPEFLIIVECKADTRKHKSKNRDKPKDFAVDGVLHYAKHLKKRFNILAIAISGVKKSTLLIDHFFFFRDEDEPEAAFGKQLLKLENYVKGYLDNKKIFRQDLDSLLSFTHDLNSDLHKLKIEASNRSLLISAILTALEDKSFKESYSDIESPGILLSNIKDRTLLSMRKTVKRSVLDNITPTYSFMDSPPQVLLEDTNLIELVEEIDDKINSFRKTHEYYDFLGQFYIEFLRYSNSDAGLGIVLTPPHITDLAARLTKVGKKDVVYDNCAGTGGFLISSMQVMIEDAKGNEAAIARIRKKGIIGTEVQPSKSALLCSNMFIHKDGRSNFIHGDCFESSVRREAQKHKPTIGLLNPPFKGHKDDTEELEFVLNNLATLSVKGKCAAILPMQCALAQSGIRHSLKQKILEEHTLEAVLSLPDQLFHNSGVGAVVCLMLFTAHQPHEEGKETWFGYCKDDGFDIRKKGRVDYYHKWDAIKENWIQSFNNREQKAGFSIMREVSSTDEWCAEAYMETDYSALTDNDFMMAIKEHVAFQFIQTSD